MDHSIFVLSCLLLCIHFSENFNLNPLQSYRWHECNMVSAMETQKEQGLKLMAKNNPEIDLSFVLFVLLFLMSFPHGCFDKMPPLRYY